MTPKYDIKEPWVKLDKNNPPKLTDYPVWLTHGQGVWICNDFEEITSSAIAYQPITKPEPPKEIVPTYNIDDLKMAFDKGLMGTVKSPCNKEGCCGCVHLTWIADESAFKGLCNECGQELGWFKSEWNNLQDRVRLGRDNAI